MARLRIAILGCGGYAGVHAQRLRQRDDVELVALCDVKDEITRAYADYHLADCPTAPQHFTDPAAMYRDAAPDAVFICTPHTLHFKHAMQALDADCHVFIEKPMVTNARQAHQLKARADESGKIVTVGYNSSCTPELQYTRNCIRTGELGKLELVVGHISQSWMAFTLGKWRQEPELSGGGQAYDSGAHLLNSLVWSVEADIDQVFAFIDNHGTKVDINSAINIRFANGVLASIAISGNCPTNGTYMSFIFDGGKINVDGWSGTWIEVFKGNRRIKYPPIVGEPVTPDDNFIDAIQGNAEPAATPANGVVQSELMDAIYESARTNAPAKPRRQ
ncbi:Gfo/Idh/MocA family protein [Phycisphaerales bacterium AB-hyl4]|uniref:Gfo/Idh/MocA family protein n=1 Tax=Natronomicrosphaera hydrolytica TaxID=3242702 RepID=A0ABV4U7E5_9BACT